MVSSNSHSSCLGFRNLMTLQLQTEVGLGLSHQPFCTDIKYKSAIDKIIVKKQPYQLLNTNREFFPSFDASNFLKLVNESSSVRPDIVAILYVVRACEGAIRRLAM